jgi:hypothetical protein
MWYILTQNTSVLKNHTWIKKEKFHQVVRFKQHTNVKSITIFQFAMSAVSWQPERYVAVQKQRMSNADTYDIQNDVLVICC